MTVTTKNGQMNKFSSHLTQVRSQVGSQAMLYGVGLTDEDMQKPQVGIVSMGWEGNTCNMHLNDLAKEVKAGVQEAGLVGLIFHTIGVSDGISMGTEGMKCSLLSRDIIADSIETVMRAQWYDANVSLPGCDKNMPGTIMAAARLNRPTIIVYGGTIRAGHLGDRKLDIISAFEAYGQWLSKQITEEELRAVLHNACPGEGACGGMYTANTMASAIEALGMSLPNSSSYPADSQEKHDECHAAGKALVNLLERDIKPKDILTMEAFENAITVLVALGGSTNAVLHLIAMAKAADVKLTIDDFQRVSQPHAAAGRHEAQRSVGDGGSVARGRRAGRHEAAARGGNAARGLHDRHGEDRGREPARNAGVDAWPGDRLPAFTADQADGPFADFVRQPRHRGVRGQDHRQGGHDLYRARQGL